MKEDSRYDALKERADRLEARLYAVETALVAVVATHGNRPAALETWRQLFASIMSSTLQVIGQEGGGGYDLQQIPLEFRRVDSRLFGDVPDRPSPPGS